MSTSQGGIEEVLVHGDVLGTLQESLILQLEVFEGAVSINVVGVEVAFTREFSVYSFVDVEARFIVGGGAETVTNVIHGVLESLWGDQIVSTKEAESVLCKLFGLVSTFGDVCAAITDHDALQLDWELTGTIVVVQDLTRKGWYVDACVTFTANEEVHTLELIEALEEAH